MYKVLAPGLPLMLAVGCVYGDDTLEEGTLQSCAAHEDCGSGSRCGGVISSVNSCFEDGYVGAEDDGVFVGPPDDQDSVFFQCDNGQRYYSYCTADIETDCDTDVCGVDHLCGKPLDGSATRTYCVALRSGTDRLWQCNPDMSCNQPSQICMRMFEYETTGYKINRRVCVPNAMIRVPPAWAAP